ncbi:uncharacterized protein B0H64DRAFT_376407 [Chaetomium fimeti]|uniref:Uncharacterized protein n=1 Tax=Chaetomium fimeti TaxID=1854472 RepID=A0AAE0HBX6_9PEZI|nr:hypothetical protein B0H64DRAFT_376407 [Chaetomium fimeti]
MPRFHSDSDSDDYVPRQHYRSPRRRSPTPGPRPVRDPSPIDDRHPRFEYEPHTPFYPPVASGGAGPSPHRSHSAGPRDTTYTTTSTTDDTPTTMPTDSTILTHRRRARDRDRNRDRGHHTPRHHRSRSSSSSPGFSYPTDSDGGYSSADDRHLAPRDRRDRRHRDHHHRHGRSNSHSKSRSPLHKAHSLLSNTFTPSTSGLGVGVLGAIVGGLAAREASEAVAGREEVSAKYANTNESPTSIPQHPPQKCNLEGIVHFRQIVKNARNYPAHG